jgi:hypothetical protein
MESKASPFVVCGIVDFVKAEGVICCDFPMLIEIVT